MIDEGMRALAEALRQQSAAYGFGVCCAPRWMTRLSGGCAR